CQQGYSYPRTF
nr:immunoglobulin light chain junction region [Macaca mulatta]MOV79135.1 immunoglobulin light chain junction region [Macaca mulatta]MOV80220.1 immunoglobulin light chain junction region [Macaca mulatta]MOV80248.1 immunoglobulin light chain junction region [Macaca mulatta]MOV81111.1 immunoglobulin light chain junction region [Macaca mulatta]